MTRRDFISAGAAALGAVAFRRHIPIPPMPGQRVLRMAVVTDLHHGLAPDAADRLKAFADAIHQRKDLDVVLQLGDFCHPVPESLPFLETWNGIKHPKLHVLGNHDMDHGDKATAMKHWGMKSRYGSKRVGDYRFVWLDLNHFRKDGKLVDYANGNYFTDATTFNLADPEQLAWLGNELRHSREPVILLSHQPLGFAEPGQAMPSEQVEVLNVVAGASKDNAKGATLVSLFGHLHVDRLEHFDRLPCYCVNSASYFWYQGMQAYTKPLYAFMEVNPEGFLTIEGVAGEFAKPPPKASDSVLGRSGSIGNQTIRFG